MKLKLFMLPFSGGSSYSYNDFLQYAPPGLELIQLELPGHGKRMAEPLLTDIHDITEDIWSQMYQNTCHPYAIYGHSLGATLGYLLCKKIIVKKIPEPVHLFVSGRVSPSCGNIEILHRLPGAAFLRGVLSYGGIPKQILREPELMRLFLPVFRADFKAIETYIYESETPLPIPVTAMAGSEDHKVPLQHLMKWQDITSHPLAVKEFTGDHFFIFRQSAKIMELIVRTLQ